MVDYTHRYSHRRPVTDNQTHYTATDRARTYYDRYYYRLIIQRRVISFLLSGRVCHRGVCWENNKDSINANKQAEGH